MIKLTDILNQVILESDPRVGTGKKPKGSSRRLYTDENLSDTVSVKFKTEEDIVEYTIKNIEGNDYIVTAQISGKNVGELRFIKSRNKPVLMAGSLSVDPNHRRKGIASSMYEFAEKELGMKFVKSEDVLTPDGKLLWNNPNRKFGN